MKILLSTLLAIFALASGFDGGALPLPEAFLHQERNTLSNCGTTRFNYEGDRIVGGRDAVQGELPWQVSLQRKGRTGSFSHICGGTILNKKYIITAAHCVDGGSAKDYQIVVGAHNLKKPSSFQVAHAVSSIKMHEKYNANTIQNDIAIMKLSTSISFSKSEGHVNGACLQESKADTTGTVSVSGWGATREGGSSPSVLQVVDVPVVSNSDCKKVYGSEEIDKNMLCAGVSKGGKDSCQGDSGGPLMQKLDGKWNLVGVVSWGYGCARPGYPGVYTRVSRFVDWIQTNTA